MEEKRKYIRIAAPMVVNYKLSGKAPVIQKTITKNFSEGGIRFDVYEKLTVGTSLDLRIETPFDTIPIFAIGQVVWSKPLGIKEGREIYDTGVKIVATKAFDKEKLCQASRRFLNMGDKYRAG